jgi:hypothetical protein
MGREKCEDFCQMHQFWPNQIFSNLTLSHFLNGEQIFDHEIAT